jgi:hypothetical protein
MCLPAKPCGPVVTRLVMMMIMMMMIIRRMSMRIALCIKEKKKVAVIDVSFLTYIKNNNQTPQASQQYNDRLTKKGTYKQKYRFIARYCRLCSSNESNSVVYFVSSHSRPCVCIHPTRFLFQKMYR